MNDIKIEKNIPIPAAVNSREKWPLDKMKVGDSFGFLADRVSAVRQRVYRDHKEGGKRFTVRKIDDDTFRCWRTK